MRIYASMRKFITSTSASFWLETSTFNAKQMIFLIATRLRILIWNYFKSEQKIKARFIFTGNFPPTPVLKWLSHCIAAHFTKTKNLKEKQKIKYTLLSGPKFFQIFKKKLFAFCGSYEENREKFAFFNG